MEQNTHAFPAAACRWLALSLLVIATSSGLGCEKSGSSSATDGEAAVFGTAAKGGNVEDARVWQSAFEAWPKEGNLNILYGSPAVQSQFENWMRTSGEPDEVLAPVFVKLEAFNDRLLALDGGWGPLTDPDKVRSMAVRGMRKTLWADLKISAVNGDASRATDLLVVMCNLPRVCHAFDGTPRGLLATMGTCDGIGWGMRDIKMAGLELDADQKKRIEAASRWLEEPAPFGESLDPETDARRATMLEQFKSTGLPAILAVRSSLLD
ncbi:MAG: hypothetical protein GY895_06690 [Phycisphaera sp.]|nr:hypothetical protein [Phycisphaera sp.]